MKWTDDTVARLKALILEELSFALIAQKLNSEFPGSGLTRNAALGKAHRLGISDSKPRNVKTRIMPGPRPTFARPARSLPPAPRTPKSAPEPKPAATKRKVSAAALEGFDRERARAACFDLPADGGGIPFDRIREGLCRWPLGDERDIWSFRFCGETTPEAQVYCPHHAALSVAPYQPRPPREPTSNRPRISRFQAISAHTGGWQ